MLKKLLVFLLFFILLTGLAKTSQAETGEGNQGSCSVDDYKSSCSPGVCCSISTCSSHKCASFDGKEYWCVPNCYNPCSGAASCSCTCDSGGGGGGGHNSITAPSINVNPNNQSNGDRYDVNFSGITHVANDPPPVGTNCSETISVLIGPDNNIPGDRFSADPYTANSCVYIANSCTSSSAANTGAKNSNGWTYQGGQICARSRLEWDGDNCVGKNAFSNIVCWECSTINSSVTPNPVLPGQQISFTFSAGYPYDFVQERFNPGGETRSCSFASSGNSWTWNCIAGTTPGTYTASFDNRQNCGKTVSYTISAPSQRTPTPTNRPTQTPTPTNRPTQTPTPTPTPTPINPPSSSWFQAAGGNIHAGTTNIPPIFSNIPTTALTPYFLINRDENPDSTGLVTTAADGNPDLGTSGFLVKDSARNWFIKDYTYSFSGRGEFDYSHFSTTLTKAVKMEKSNLYTLSGKQIVGTAPNDTANLSGNNNIWNITKDLTISGNLDDSLGTQIILVKGQINIETDIEKSINTFPVFISSGSIKIDPSVQKLNGVFITNDIFETGSNSPDNPLTIENGMAISYGGFSLDRNPPDKTTPAEKFIFDPEYIIKLSEILGRSKNRWQEINP